MVADKRELIDRAQKLASRGLIDKAISEWQKLFSGTQNDGDIHNTIGDLHLRANRSDAAISAYLKAADVFQASGFELKCAALLKKVIKIDPSRMDVCEKLADVHADRGLVGNAASDYLKVVDYYTQRGEYEAVLSVYQKLSRLDPKCAETHLNMAETCQKLGLLEKAVVSCERALSLYEDRQLTEVVRQRIEQILKTVPHTSHIPERRSPPSQESVSSLSDRMQAALRVDDWEGAQEIIKVLTEVPEVQFRFLSEWFDVSLRKNVVSRAFLVLHKALLIAERHPACLGEAQALLRRYVEACPDQLSAQELLAETLEKSRNVKEAGPVYSKIISLLLAQGAASDATTYYEMMKVKYRDQALAWKDQFEPVAPHVVFEEGTFPVFVEEPETGPELEPVDVAEPLPLPEADEAERGKDSAEVLFNSYLTEADVYAKYKLYGKAAEQLRSLVRLAPMRVEPYLRLKDIYLHEEMVEQAVEACMALLQIYEAQGADDQKQAMLEALSEMDPEGVYHARRVLEQDNGAEQRETREVRMEDGVETVSGMGVEAGVVPEMSETTPDAFVAQDDAGGLLEQSLPGWVSRSFVEAVLIRSEKSSIRKASEESAPDPTEDPTDGAPDGAPDESLKLEDEFKALKDVLTFKDQVALFQGVTDVCSMNGELQPELPCDPLLVPSSILQETEVSAPEMSDPSDLGSRTGPSLSTVAVKRKKKNISYL